MKLNSFNKLLGVIPPAEAFKSCPRCKSTKLFDFEGEVFCQRCEWDSVALHAEILAEVRLRRKQTQADIGSVRHVSPGLTVCPTLMPLPAQLYSSPRPIQANPGFNVPSPDVA
jgi:hypothetical protein